MKNMKNERGNILSKPEKRLGNAPPSRFRYKLYLIGGFALIIIGLFIMIANLFGYLKTPTSIPSLFGFDVITLMVSIFAIIIGIFVSYINGLEEDIIWEKGLTTTISFIDKLRGRDFLSFKDIDKVYYGQYQKKENEYYGKYGEKVREKMKRKHYLILTHKNKKGPFWRSKIPHFRKEDYDDDFFKKISKAIKQNSPKAKWVKKDFKKAEEMKKYFKRKKQ